MAARPPKLLRVPGRLTLLAIGLVSTSCSPPTAPDVVDVDTGHDVIASDVACDVPVGGAGYECIQDPRADVIAACPGARTCEPSSCPTACISCYGAAYTPAGYACLRDPRGDPSVTCPTQRLCTQADCPAGCIGCASPFGCVPRPLADGGLPAPCVPRVVCDPADCPSNCLALG